MGWLQHLGGNDPGLRRTGPDAGRHHDLLQSAVRDSPYLMLVQVSSSEVHQAVLVV